MTDKSEERRQFTPAEHAEAERTLSTLEYAAYIRSERCPPHARHVPLPKPPDDDSLHEEWLREAADEREHSRRMQALEAWARWQFG